MQGARRRTRRRSHGFSFNRDVIGPLRSGDLTKFGYSSKASKTKRHSALARALHSYSPLTLFRKLQAVTTLNKRRSKGRSKTFRADRNWVRKTFM
jgi:hypothetical protein